MCMCLCLWKRAGMVSGAAAQRQAGADGRSDARSGSTSASDDALSVDARDPAVRSEAVRVEVVHLVLVPAGSGRAQQRLPADGNLLVCRGVQTCDLETVDLLSVKGVAVLGEAQQPAVDVQHPTRGPGDVGVGADDGARRMLDPRPF